MKRFLLFFAAAFVILACSKDEEAIPVAPKSKFNLTIVATEGGSVSTTGGSYEEGSTVSVTATAASGYRFVEWSNGETTATINITVLGNITLTATFEKLAYSIEVSGAIVKGAFATGSTLTFYELTKALSQTGKTFNTDITDKYGSYSLSVEEVTEDYARVVGEGFYWNEVTNKTTSEKITLNALSEIKEGLNVNILTHLEYPRVEQLVKTEGKSFSDAKRQALIEVLSSLGIETTTDYGTAEQFNFVNGDDRSKILAVASVIIQAERSPAEVTAFITEVANDLKDNGSIDNTELKTEIAIPLAKIDLQKTATNIYNHYKEQNPELSTEDYISDYLETAKAEFQQYLPDADGDGVQDDLDQCPDTPSDEEADSNGCGKSQKAYLLTTTVEGSGSISEEIIVQPTASYDYGTTVRVTANPIVGWEFKEWKGDISSTEISYDILIQEEVSVTAVFVRKQYGLDLTIEGEGSVSKNPDQSSYEYQSNAELTATPAEGWVFKEWRGDLPSATNPITVAFNSDKEMVAVFQRKTYDLNITISGEGAVAEEVITTPGRYEGGTAVELTATPANGWVFTGWSGDITSDQNPINITLTEEKNITATFTKKNFTLTTSKDGEGSVVVDPEKETYEFKTPIKITAAAAEGWAFNKWTGDIESEENPLNIEIDDNLTVNAVFKRKQYDLTVTIEGEGTVEEEIVVAPTKYDYETQVKLTAVAKEGWEFASWGGDLQGTENPATITVTTGQSVTATFTAIPGGIYLDSNGLTIKANVTAKVGERYILEDTGEEYLVVDEEMLRNMAVDWRNQDLSKVVTTKVTNMNGLFYYETYTTFSEGWDEYGESELLFQEEYPMYQGLEESHFADFNQDLSSWDVSNVEFFFTTFMFCDSFNSDISHWDMSGATYIRSMFNRASSFNQDIGDWDVSNVTSMARLFRGATAFNKDIGNWDVSNVTDMFGMFEGYMIEEAVISPSFNRAIGNWDTSNVRNMAQMFYQNKVFDRNISEWNVSNVTDMGFMFRESNFNQPIGSWDVSNVTNMQSLFEQNSAFNQAIGEWDVSNVTNMWAMFYGTPFNQPIGNWNVSSVTNMQALFSNNTAFNQDIANWDVSKVENMSWMFFNNTSFNQPIGNWNVSKVKTFKQMFDRTTFNQDIGSWDVSGAESLSEMFWSNTEFNQDISDWNVSNVTNMYRMFQNASAFNQNIGAWDVSKVTNMNEMFNNASSFSQDLSDWCVVNLTSEPNLFYEGSGIVNEQLPNWGQCPGVVGSIYLDENGVTVKADQYASVGQTYILEETGEEYLVVNEEMLRSMALDHSSYDLSKVITTRVTDMNRLFLDQENFNQNIGSWDLSNVLNISEIFRGTSSFNQDISSWNVANVTNMYRMFMNASSFNQNISGWNVSKVTNMNGMFQEASIFNQPIGNWNVSNVTDMGGMFIGAAVFNQDISIWDVSNVTNMRLMFSNAYSFNYSLNDWDVSNVTFMTWMFQNASSFNQPLDKWDVSNVISIRWMFAGASSFNQPIGNWNVSKVVGMSYTFERASAFNQPINNWDVSQVTDMSGMFSNADNFDQPIDDWNVSKVTNMERMFFSADKFDQNISSWDVSNVTNMRLMFSIAATFNQNIGEWDTSSVLDMTGMFSSAYSFNQDISSWDVSQVTDVSKMFESATLFNQPIDSWDVSNVTNMDDLFFNTPNFNQDLSSWCVTNISSAPNNFATGSGMLPEDYPIWGTCGDVVTGIYLDANGVTVKATEYAAIGGTYTLEDTGVEYLVVDEQMLREMVENGQDISIAVISKVTDLSNLFRGNASFNQDISSWDTSNVISMYGLFNATNTANGNSFNQDISLWDVSKVEDFSYMFWGNSVFNQDLNSWNVSRGKYFNYMFAYTKKFNSDLNNWDLSSAISIDYIFSGSKSFNGIVADWQFPQLKSLAGVFKETEIFNQNLNKWDVGSIEQFGELFYGAINFNGDISEWNTSSATSLQWTFMNAESFNQNIANWDVSNVSNFWRTFMDAQVFNQNISGWDTSSAITMKSMFSSSLSTDLDGGMSFNQDLSGWNVNKVTECTDFSAYTNFLDTEPKWVLPKPNFTNCNPE